jgi:hypothetical protein
MGTTRAAYSDIRLTFPVDNSSGTATRKIVVGSASMPGGGASAGTFEIDLGEELKQLALFSVSLDKGSVPPDSKLDITFAYKPSVSATGGHQGLEVGQWVKFPVKLILKGGYKPLTDPDALTVVIVLEAFVHL